MGLETRDRVELGVAIAILTVFLTAELSNNVGFDQTVFLNKLLVITALLAIFGDNVSKARAILTGG